MSSAIITDRPEKEKIKEKEKTNFRNIDAKKTQHALAQKMFVKVVKICLLHIKVK